jgi:lipopolysaccharide transport system ATP-binding protein
MRLSEVWAGEAILLRAQRGQADADAPFSLRWLFELVGRERKSLIDLMVGMDPFATGLENIRMRALIMGLTNKQINDRIEEIAEFSALGPFLGMPVKAYSAGMVARLAFSVTTSVEADILLMDEWIGVGDAEFRHSAQLRLTKLVEEAKIFVFASHDFVMLKQMCNKFIGLKGGRSTGLLSEAELDEFVALS